jgi:translocation and assembly module TamA
MPKGTFSTFLPFFPVLRKAPTDRPLGFARWLTCCVVAAVGTFAWASFTPDSAARTADIAVNVTGDEKFGEELKDLVQKAEKEQPSTGDAITVLQGVQARRQRIAQALRSRGYYGAEVTTTVLGRPLEDPEIVTAVEAQAEGSKVPVVIGITTGPVYHMGAINVQPATPDVTLPPLDRTKLALAPGKPADTAGILAVQEQVLVQAREQGYALAEMTERRVVVDHAIKLVNVDFSLATGPTARMGRVRFAGTDKIDTTFLQKRVPFSPGEPYHPSKVTRLTERLTSLGVFNQVKVTPGTTLDANGELPFDVEVADRPPRTIGFGAAYETQRGFSVNGFWLHRNLFGEAESLRLSAEVNRLAQGPIDDIGFTIKATFRKPDWWLPEQDAFAEIEAAREIFDAYRRRGAKLTFGIDRALTRKIRVKAGLTGEYSLIERQGILEDYQLIGLPLALLIDMSNNELEPTEGWRLNTTLTPYVDIGQAGEPFAIFRTTGTAYFDVAGVMGWEFVGRSVIAARASFGTIPGIRTGAIPPDKLFYAGGGGSVRGFAYQTAGPRDSFYTPLGGASLIEANIEFRQRIGNSFGVVAFIDAGSAYANTLPDFNEAPRIGAGLGVRYYTDFGPVRLDVGVPLNKRPGDADFGIYVSLGQAF